MRRDLVGMVLTALFVGAGATAGATLAQEYQDVDVPTPVRVIVAYSAGGSTDTQVRVTNPYFEKHIEELTGKRISAVVVNLPGAGGEVGWTALVNADADGSTIGIINLPAVPLVEIARDTDFEPWLENFTPLGVNVIDPNVIMLGERSPYASLEEAIEAAKDDPGSVTVGADGPLSDDHLANYAIEEITGATFTFIPYDGGAPALRALRGGEVDITIGNSNDYLGNTDTVKDAALFRKGQLEQAPDLPTVEETFGEHVGDLGSTRGWAAPAGVPDEVIEVYREALARAMNDPEFIEEAKERNLALVDPLIGDQFGAYMQEQNDLAQRLITYFERGGYLK